MAEEDSAATEADGETGNIPSHLKQKVPRDAGLFVFAGSGNFSGFMLYK